MSDANYIGDKIKELRKERGWSQRLLGEKFSPPKSFTVISRWERGKVVPSTGHIREMAGIFQISTEVFICPASRQTIQAN
ncbi:helix-turn-helix protein [Pelotomaculum schinkii]|uniref:Helix-turn-helix protein n=1 Tax=Pelotomaculum schinkii TaxID=78350 RepID=A0A4Y7RCP3_9FIRM|nr:helix-turn-helix transcriptional regulator [Pelotomaculum schinkii]TEB06493.1 helix-turn-helix protein [Pelotomaculum schinkii]